MKIKNLMPISPMMFVVDSSALFVMESPPEDSICPPGVMEELRRYDDPRLERWFHLMRVSDCTVVSMQKVKEAARKSGDISRLSDTDITVIALAVDTGGTILTDDYSIQNVARIMGVDYKAVGTSGITKVEKWNYRCNGCGRWSKDNIKECPICGHSAKPHRKR